MNWRCTAQQQRMQISATVDAMLSNGNVAPPPNSGETRPNPVALHPPSLGGQRATGQWSEGGENPMTELCIRCGGPIPDAWPQPLCEPCWQDVMEEADRALAGMSDEERAAYDASARHWPTEILVSAANPAAGGLTWIGRTRRGSCRKILAFESAAYVPSSVRALPSEEDTRCAPTTQP
jgi:hypothetical protein